MVRKTCWWDVPPEHAYKHRVLLISKGSYHSRSRCSRKPWEGLYFPKFPLRVKCQNHERVPISPISPILVANVYSSCQDMDHQNRGNRDPLSAFPWWSAKTMRGSLFPVRGKCQNHERVPISPISPILVANVYSSCQNMDHQIRGNRDPLNVFPSWCYFPYFP